jgi:probable rRNA maturation factor
MPSLVLRNRQRAAKVDIRKLRSILRSLLQDVLGVKQWALGIHLVGDETIIELNEKYLKHRGATDVVSFNYLDGTGDRETIAGDIFVCVPEAVRQAPRFRSTWQAELVRYIVHGILHLSGYDDRTAANRREMKREEGRLLKALSRQLPFSKLGRAIASRRE